MQCGLLSQPSGSAYVECGGSKVVAAVYGPREIPRRSDFSSQKGVLSCQISASPFSGSSWLNNKRSSNIKSDPEKDAGLFLRDALKSTVCLHLYPKSQIDVYVNILEDSNEAMSAAVTAAGLALASAGIQMFDLVLGGCSEQTVVAFQPRLHQIAGVFSKYKGTPEQVMQEIESITNNCTQILPLVQQSLLDYSVMSNSK